MARTDTLTHFLTDVADAIRTKTGSSAAIDADDFDTEIENIPSSSGHDWSAIGFREEPIASQSHYQRAVDLKTNWDPETTEMPSGKFQQAYHFYIPDIDMRNITTADAFANCFECVRTQQVRVGSQTTNVSYPAGGLEAIANIKAKPYGSVANMFCYCHRLVQLDLSGIDTSEITNMSSMFKECSNLSSIDLSGFNTSKVTAMNSMFYNCVLLSSLDLSGFDTSEVTNMNSMLYGVIRGYGLITSLNLSNFNTSKVTDMGYMFYSNTALTSLDISSFSNPTTANIYLAYMFGYCTSLTHIDMRNLIVSGITTASKYSNMFGSAASSGVPDDCEIIVKDDTEKTWINTKFPRLTNVKTVAEYEAEQSA